MVNPTGAEGISNKGSDVLILGLILGECASEAPFWVLSVSYETKSERERGREGKCVYLCVNANRRVAILLVITPKIRRIVSLKRRRMKFGHTTARGFLTGVPKEDLLLLKCVCAEGKGGGLK